MRHGLGVHRQRIAGLLAFSALAWASYGAAQVGRWVPIGPSGERAVIQTIAIDPRTSSTIFLGLGSAPDGPAGGVFKSTDTGASWTLLSLPDSSSPLGRPIIFSLGIDPATPDTMYAATYNSGVLRTTNGGASWSGSSQGLNLQRPGLQQVTALAIDPRTPATLYAGLTVCFSGFCDGAVFKTTDGGATWSRPNPAPHSAVSALAIDQTSTSTIYAGAGFLTSPGVFKSTDGGASWSQLAGLPTLPVFSIAVAPGSPLIVYVGLGGLYRSTDGGASWSLLSGGLPPGAAVSSLAIDHFSPRVLYAGIAGRGIYRSADGGNNWWPLNEGLTNLIVTALAIDPRDSSILYAGTSGGGCFRIRLPGDNAGLCSPSASALCLAGQRFRAEVAWRAPNGTTGLGQTVPITSNTGAFWFFSPDNLELVVKVLDGRSLNGKWWVFYGALSNVEYTLTVTDTVTGATKTYFNPQGQLASAADTGAF